MKKEKQEEEEKSRIEIYIYDWEDLFEKSKLKNIENDDQQELFGRFIEKQFEEQLNNDNTADRTRKTDQGNKGLLKFFETVDKEMQQAKINTQPTVKQTFIPNENNIDFSGFSKLFPKNSQPNSINSNKANQKPSSPKSLSKETNKQSTPSKKSHSQVPLPPKKSYSQVPLPPKKSNNIKTKISQKSNEKREYQSKVEENRVDEDINIDLKKQIEEHLKNKKQEKKDGPILGDQSFAQKESDYYNEEFYINQQNNNEKENNVNDSYPSWFSFGKNDYDKNDEAIGSSKEGKEKENDKNKVDFTSFSFGDNNNNNDDDMGDKSEMSDSVNRKENDDKDDMDDSYDNREEPIDIEENDFSKWKKTNDLQVKLSVKILNQKSKNKEKEATWKNVFDSYQEKINNLKKVTNLESIPIKNDQGEDDNSVLETVVPNEATEISILVKKSEARNISVTTKKIEEYIIRKEEITDIDNIQYFVITFDIQRYCKENKKEDIIFRNNLSQIQYILQFNQSCVYCGKKKFPERRAKPCIQLEKGVKFSNRDDINENDEEFFKKFSLLFSETPLDLRNVKTEERATQLAFSFFGKYERLSKQIMVLFIWKMLGEKISIDSRVNLENISGTIKDRVREKSLSDLIDPTTDLGVNSILLLVKVFSNLQLKENIAAYILRTTTKFSFVDERTYKRICEDLIKKIQIELETMKSRIFKTRGEFLSSIKQLFDIGHWKNVYSGFELVVKKKENRVFDLRITRRNHRYGEQISTKEEEDCRNIQNIEYTEPFSTENFQSLCHYNPRYPLGLVKQICFSSGEFFFSQTLLKHTKKKYLIFEDLTNRFLQVYATYPGHVTRLSNLILELVGYNN